jgi:hypothetical protein
MYTPMSYLSHIAEVERADCQPDFFLLLDKARSAQLYIEVHGHAGQ